MKNPMTDPDFAEFGELWPIKYSDEQAWTKRDRDVAAVREIEVSESELLSRQRRSLVLRERGFPEESLFGGLSSSPRQTAALAHAKAFSKMPARMLVLCGGVGVGKTTAASWLALQREDEHPTFIRVGELERRGRYDKSLSSMLKECSSLVLDDLGVEIVDGKGVFVSFLDEVINAAYARRHVVVITTNLEFDQLRARYGSRIYSRLEQTGVIANCGMHDIRMERA